MNNIENQELLTPASTLKILKDDIDKAISILIDMLNNNKNMIIVDKQQDLAFISFFAFNELIKKDIKYSIKEDLEYTTSGDVIIKNKNFNEVKDRLLFLNNYLNYRVNSSTGIAKC